jgi:hypothetical protein
LRVRRVAAVLWCACAVAAGLACATSAAPPRSDVPACQGLAPPRVVGMQRVDLPASLASVRLAGELPAEVTVAGDGSARESAMRTGDLPVLASFVQETLKHTRFDAGSFEGNAAAVRIPVQVPIGGPRPPATNPRAPAEVWAYVAAGQSREARWQLRGSVAWVTVSAHAPKLPAPGAEIVAVAPDGQTLTLVKVPASNRPQDVRQTVATGKFFAATGTYRLELRASKVLASAHFTIADDYRGAVINACEPLTLPRKTGPGN